MVHSILPLSWAGPHSLVPVVGALQQRDGYDAWQVAQVSDQAGHFGFSYNI